MGIFDQIKAAFTNTDEAPTKPLSKPDPQPEAPVGPASGQRKGNSYTVQSGDSLWSIARKHKVKLNDLMRWNGLDQRAVLQPGQSLKILF